MLLPGRALPCRAERTKELPAPAAPPLERTAGARPSRLPSAGFTEASRRRRVGDDGDGDYDGGDGGAEEDV